MTFGMSDRTTRPSPPGGRSRARTAALIAFAGWAVLEIWLLTVVAGAIGGGPLLLLLLAQAVLGALTVRHAGRRAWNGLVAAARSAAPDGRAGPGKEPGRDPLPGTEGAGTTMLGGLLLMVPGFASDVVGLLCLLPPTRGLLRAAGTRLGRRLGRPAGPLGETFARARAERPDGRVVPGEVIRDGAGGGAGSGGADGEGPRSGPRPPLTP